MKNKYIFFLLFSVFVLCCIGGVYFVKQRSTLAQTDIIAEVKTEVAESTEAVKQKTEEMIEVEETENVLESEKDVVVGEETRINQKIEQLLKEMSMEEKVAQLFIILPEALVDGVSCVTAAGEATENAINAIPVGGIIYMEKNLQSAEQVKTMLNNIQSYSMDRIELPAFLCVDEEGGSVTRISGTGKFNVPITEDMSVIGETQDVAEAYKAGKNIGQYLSELGFNVDFAPVADVLSNPNNKVVKNRSFGNEPQTVSDMAYAVLCGLEENDVYGTYKHFPGHGATTGDTHTGYSYTDKTLEELKVCELIPFQKGIEKGISFVMVGHISLPNVVGDNTPASLSKVIITDLLRNEMGYEGIIITDALNMGAIVQQYSLANAAIKTLQAGADLVLMPADFHAAYQGVLDAVERGEIPVERIDESVKRIINVKIQLKR